MTRSAKVAADFVSLVAALKFENAFNPYVDLCSEFDKPNAPELRRSNLERVFHAALDTRVDTIWIARDLGYRGGRRTGLALTDEAHLEAHASLYRIDSLARSTNGPVVAERTAKVIWDMLFRIGQPVFLWNVFPLHPHEADSPLTNRCHTRAERLACRHIMLSLIQLLRPNSVLTIGRDAEQALADLGVGAKCVRHPSYGGQSEFIDGVSAHYGLNRDNIKRGALPLFDN
jgi:hypothetical protein